MRFTLDFLRAGDCFVDVGANVGSYSLLAAGVPGVQVVAFEPSTLACRRLQENIAINQLERRIDVRQVAVGASGGLVAVTIGCDAVNHVVAAEDSGSSEKVVMVSLDDALGGPVSDRISLVKIDVEGFEREVLRGAERLVETVGPVLIVEANDPASVRALLEPLGYGAYHYDPDRRRVDRIDWLDVRDNNLLLFRDRSSVDDRLLTVAGTRGSARGAM